MSTADPTDSNPTPFSRASIIQLQKSMHLSHPLSAANSVTALLCKAVACMLTCQLSQAMEELFPEAPAMQHHAPVFHTEFPCSRHHLDTSARNPPQQDGYSATLMLPRGCFFTGRDQGMLKESSEAHPPHHSLTG